MNITKHGKLSTEIELALLLAFIFMLCFGPSSAEVSTEAAENKSELLTYIIQVQKPQGDSSLDSEDLRGYYHTLLPESAKTPKREHLVYLYRNVIAGFAAKLTAEEAKALEEKEEIVSARPERILSLHTTHTPAFLGLQQGLGLWKGSNYGKGIIIGVLDTGIYPSHSSFSHEGMPDPPAKWKGYCEFTGKRTCNNKLIGARNLAKSSTTDLPYDEEGHGTHTASTAAGRFVQGASIFGNANSTAVGMAPDAHLAIYKVCQSDGCSESAILAGMDAAIEDGVDVISLSIGGPSKPFFDDPIAFGAFRAFQKGIFVSCSAANAGPYNYSLANDAPWILTVGAASTDRRISAAAKLGNGVQFHGETAFQPKDFKPDLLPLVYPGANGNDSQASCVPGSLKNLDIKGKVVVCDEGGYIGGLEKGTEVKDAGGAAMIFISAEVQGLTSFADDHVLPAVNVNYRSGLAIKEYLNSTSKPTSAIIFEGTVIGNLLSPGVASFSSRGPSLTSPGILKPDIIGPGLNILAAWSVSVDNNYPPFNMISGTSMSCPHLSGIAALLKNSHPDWSPAAIKSAIMTTADKVNHKGIPILDERLQPADLFAIGAGHVNPLKAKDPGLVYDIEPNDYIPYLCGLGYTDKQVWTIVHKKVKCSEVKIIPEAQLNYPSFSIILGSTSQSYTRTLTNVGPANSTYTVAINPPPGVVINISPTELTFSKVNQKVIYSVEFIPQDKKGKRENTFVQGSLKWVSGTETGSYSVSTPISVSFK